MHLAGLLGSGMQLSPPPLPPSSSSLAGACIDGLDHHCPWMGKCVGAGNLRYFRLFNWSWLTYSLYMCVCIALKEGGLGS